MLFLRCKNCNKKLFKYDIHIGELEIMCPKCGAKIRLEATMKPDIKVSLVKEQNR